MAAAAIREYVSVNEWQIAEIRQGLEEADREEFASQAQVRRSVAMWTTRAKRPQKRARG